MRPNQAMERMATRRAFTFCVAQTSLLRVTLGLGDLCRGFPARSIREQGI